MLSQNGKIKVFSCFSGVAGFELGIIQALGKENVDIVGFSELDRYAISIYKKHYPNHKNYGDIKILDTADLPSFDLLVGGSPCPSFSIAGKRKAFDDTRGRLFYDYVRILKDKRPRHFIFENVKGLLSADSGKAFQKVLRLFSEAGYECQWSLHNTKDYGIPQNRERLFIIGYLGGRGRRQILPFKRANEKGIKQINQPKHSNDRVYDPQGISPTLNTIQGGNRQPFIACELRCDEGVREFSDNIMGILRANSSWNGGKAIISKTVRVGGRGSPHGSKQNWDSYEVDDVIRRLTPVEVARLQGFSDSWCDIGINEKGEEVKISNSQIYKTLGNAVTVNVVELIIKKLFNL